MDGRRDQVYTLMTGISIGMMLSAVTQGHAGAPLAAAGVVLLMGVLLWYTSHDV